MTLAAAEGVGIPAAFGAAARAVATAKGLMNDPFAEPLVRAVGVEFFVGLINDERFAADAGDYPPMSGFLALCAAHARFVDELLADAGRAGIRQVVIMASGLDTRPYRLWWPHGTTVYEIDRPGVLDFKADVLRGLGAELTTNRCAVGVGLHQDWPEALRRLGFDAAAPTVWVAEQLLIGQLPPDEQNRLLDDVTALSAARSRFAADHLPTWTPLQLEAERAFVDGFRRHGLDVDLASLNHPGQYHYVPDYLAGHGWAKVERNVTDLLSAMGLAAAGPVGTGLVPEYVTATRG